MLRKNREKKEGRKKDKAPVKSTKSEDVSLQEHIVAGDEIQLVVFKIADDFRDFFLDDIFFNNDFFTFFFTVFFFLCFFFEGVRDLNSFARSPTSLTSLLESTPEMSKSMIMRSPRTTTSLIYWVWSFFSP